MNDAEYNELRAASWRRKLTSAEEERAQAYWATHPEAQTAWEEDLALTRAVSDAVSVPVIASGGAGTLAHLAEVLDRGHASAVLAASIFHFGTFTVPQAKDYLAAQGVPVRL